MWRHLFAAAAAIVLVFFTVILVRGPSTGPTRNEILKPARPPHQRNWDNAVALVPLMVCEISAVFFVVDSLRRQYRGSRAVAVAMAFFGLLTLGAGSLVYYALWGHRPLQKATEVYGNAFCSRCVASTTGQPAPGSAALNVVLGTRYMGSADRCDACRSVIRTLWVWLVVPVIPLGSYRVIATDASRFIGRRTKLRWSQVVGVYGITMTVALAIVYCFVRG